MQRKKQYCVTQIKPAQDKGAARLYIYIAPFEDFGKKELDEYLIDMPIPYVVGNEVAYEPAAIAPNAPMFDIAFKQYQDVLKESTIQHLLQLRWEGKLEAYPVWDKQSFIKSIKGAIDGVSRVFMDADVQVPTEEEIVPQNEENEVHAVSPTQPIEMTQVVAGYKPDEERVTVQVHYTDNNRPGEMLYFDVALPYLVEKSHWGEDNRVVPTEFCMPIAPAYCQELVPFNNVAVFGEDLNNLVTALLEDLHNYRDQRITLYDDVTDLKEDVVKRMVEVQVMFEQKLLDSYRSMRFQDPVRDEDVVNPVDVINQVLDRCDSLEKRIDKLYKALNM